MSAEARVAVITGGASGIGLASARRLLADGWSVLVGDLNPESGASAIAEAAEVGLEGRLEFVRCDVSAESEVEALIAAAGERLGRLDCLVNNAGVPGAFGRIEEIEVADWDATFAILVRGVFLGTKHAVRAFDAAGEGGAIVNVASIAGLSGGGGPQAYSAAKAAVISLTKSSAVELAPRRIRVNAVAPGPVMTPILGSGASRMERAAAALETTQPWPRAGTAEDVAGPIVFLASPDAGFITGETIVVDGGQTAAGPAEAMERLANPRARGLSGVSYGSSGLAGATRGNNSRGGADDA